MNGPLSRMRAVHNVYADAVVGPAEPHETPTETALRKFKEALAARQSAPPIGSRIHPMLWEAEREAIASEILILQARADRERRAREFKEHWAEFRSLLWSIFVTERGWVPATMILVILGFLVWLVVR